MFFLRCINLLKNKNLAKILSAGLAVAVLCSVMAFPAFAETLEIDGYTFNKVTFTTTDLQNLISGGFLNVSVSLSVSSGTVRVANLSDGTFSSVRSSNGTVEYPITYSAVLDDFRVFFYSPYVINVNQSNSQYTIAYNFSFSFDGYIYNDSIFVSDYYVGDSSYSNTSQTIRFLTSDLQTLSYSSSFLSSAYHSWSDSPLSLIISQFPNDPTSTALPYSLTYSSSPSDLSIPTAVTQITFSEACNLSPGSVSSSSSEPQSPLAFILNTFSFYELVSGGTDPDDPDDPGTDPDPDDPGTGEISAILEYLQTPSQENLDKIAQVRSDLEFVKQQLINQSNDLAVDVPDISDVESTIPEELTQGNEIVSEQVLSPILNAQPIATIFLGLFAIVSLKLFLFGSGPH